MLKEMGSYKGHMRDVMCAAWHPLHEELFSSGSQDGCLMYWMVSRPTPQVCIDRINCVLENYFVQ